MTTATPPAAPASPAPAKTLELTVHPLDSAAYAELERAPGVYGIEPVLLQPQADPRIPAPPAARLLLRVSFTLLQAEVPFGSRWQLQATGPGADGQPRRVHWTLVPLPHKHDNRRRITPEASPAPAPGALDSGVFWVDLSSALQQGLLRPGDQLVLSLAQAQAAFAMPGR